jgi:hypothetical protein
MTQSRCNIFPVWRSGYIFVPLAQRIRLKPPSAGSRTIRDRLTRHLLQATSGGFPANTTGDLTESVGAEAHTEPPGRRRFAPAIVSQARFLAIASWTLAGKACQLTQFTGNFDARQKPRLGRVSSPQPWASFWLSESQIPRDCKSNPVTR